MRVTGITQYIELTVRVFHNGPALSFCTEGLTGPANEVYAGRGDMGEGRVLTYWEFLSLPGVGDFRVSQATC